MYCTFARFEEAKGLKVDQLQFKDDEVLVKFKKGKTYQMGESRFGVMPRVTGDPVAPVEVLEAYLLRLGNLRGNHENWLFPGIGTNKGVQFSLNKPVSYDYVARCFKTLVAAVGLVREDGGVFGLHSMRRGAATTAVNAGASEHAVMKQMRVMSGGTVRRYASLDVSVLRGAALAAM